MRVYVILSMSGSFVRVRSTWVWSWSIWRIQCTWEKDFHPRSLMIIISNPYFDFVIILQVTRTLETMLTFSSGSFSNASAISIRLSVTLIIWTSKRAFKETCPCVCEWHFLPQKVNRGRRPQKFLTQPLMVLGWAPERCEGRSYL